MEATKVMMTVLILPVKTKNGLDPHYLELVWTFPFLVL